jgi:beta-glucosidase
MRVGQEVVQFYVQDAQSSLARPEKELKGFAKLHLVPGETAVAAIDLDLRSLAFFDDRQRAWVAEAGEFTVSVGRSSGDIRAQATFRLTETVVIPA